MSAPRSVLSPHPHWRWGSYPLRWLVGGCWSLAHALPASLLYGCVFFATAWAWTRALAGLTPHGFGFATVLTAVTLALAPALTVALCGPVSAARRGSAAPKSPDLTYRNAALLGLGLLLVMLLILFLNVALFSFALLFQGPVPSLGRLVAAVFSWANAPLAAVLLLALVVAVLVMQAVAALPTLALCGPHANAWHAMYAGMRATRRNWRPLACWALGAQALVLGVGALIPAALILLAPIVAHGSWWAWIEVDGGPGARARHRRDKGA